MYIHIEMIYIDMTEIKRSSVPHPTRPCGHMGKGPDRGGGSNSRSSRSSSSSASTTGDRVQVREGDTMHGP